jgi:pimeloyl-ACP methyl ester carboxylesterase
MSGCLCCLCVKSSPGRGACRVYPTDVAQGITGKRILIVHGSADRIASPARSVALADTLGHETDVAYVTINGGKYAMLGRHALFDQLAAEFVVWTLLGAPASKTIARIENGERRIQI